MRHFLTALVLAGSLGALPLASAQVAAPETQPPASQPALDTSRVRLRLQEGKLAGSFEYALVVGTFYEWNTDPTAVPGLMSELTRRTGIRAGVNFSPIALDENRIRRNPLLILTGNRFFHLTDAETRNLRRYLRAGGFIYADDCGGADRSFRDMIKALLPEATLAELQESHPIFHSFYRLRGTPKVLDLYAGPAKGYGAHLDGRLAIFYTYDTDVPCGWEKNPDGSFVHLLTRAKHEAAYQMGVNVVMYVLGELHRRRLAPPALAATRPAPRRAEAILPGPLRTYRMKPLMPCNLICAIVPAGRYVWFAGRRTLPGEQEGLARYDYQTDTWQLLLDSEGVLADEINCLAADDAGLWIGSSTIRRRWNYGLWYYDVNHSRSRRYTTVDGLVDHDVYDLVVDGEMLWVATRAGLAGYNRKAETWMKDADHCQTYLDLTTCLAADERYVWFGRANGLRRYDKRSGTYQDFNASNSPISGMVDVLVKDGQTLWISAPPKLLTFRAGRFSAPPGTAGLAAAGILAGAADEKALCFGTRTGGLHLLDKRSGNWQIVGRSSGLPSNCVSQVALDRRSVWCAFGSAPLGVGRRDRASGKWSFHTYRAGIPCNHLYSLATDGKTLYVGTMANGLWKYELAADRWVNLNLPHRAEHAPVRRCDVYALLLAPNALWLGTNRGLCRHQVAAESYEIIQGPAVAVAALAEHAGRVLCGTRREGLIAYRPDDHTWSHLGRRCGLPDVPVTALAGRQQRLWVGTEKGLFLLDLARERALPLPGALKQMPVTALLLSDEAIWIGTADGLFRYVCQPEPAPLGSKPVVAHVHVTALAAGRSGVLIGTPNGLAYLPARSRTALWEKRLGGQAVRALAPDAQRLWIGTMGSGLHQADSAPVR